MEVRTLSDVPLCLFAEKGGNPAVVRDSQRKRYADPAAVDKVIALDKEWRDGKQFAWLLTEYGGSGGCQACIPIHCMQP